MTAPSSDSNRNIRRAAQVIVVGSVMFTFISFWKTAAVVLCDLASTAYYIGGIAEQAIGPAAPWFILAVMVFSYAVRNVYIESCSMFVRGGVYKVVREAMGGFMGKLSVSALIFDYILTGPISSVTAGQYLFGLLIETARYVGLPLESKEAGDAIKQYGSVVFAVVITLYFYWQNLKGIHESSDKAFKIMIATTVMAVILLVWCGLTLAIDGPRNKVPLIPDFHPKMNFDSHKIEDPLGFISNTGLGETMRQGGFRWLSIFGLLGILVAFGHSILAMSGEETLAQVYREVEAPKLRNFRKAAFVVFVYSMALTSTISFLAVLLIPDEVRMRDYSSNLIGGLSMYLVGPQWAKLLLNAFVVGIGALILSGAVNTAIIGSNGVLNRVAEDGVLPDWLLKPHPRFGTSYRVLTLILFLKLATILVSGGDVLLLGEAYAFGVVWSFVFMSASMVILRFKDRKPREYRMPFNVNLGGVELPLGLIAVFLCLFGAAIMNLLTKEIATVAGVSFTAVFLLVFSVTEWLRRKPSSVGGVHGDRAAHVEQFTVESKEEPGLSPAVLGLATKPYLKLIAIRSPQNLFMLEKSLAETDPETTNVVVMTAKILPQGVEEMPSGLDPYEQRLMTAVVDRAEKAGKQVKPLIVPTNSPLNAVLQTARDLHADEVVMGASNKYATDMQLEELQFNWMVVNGGQMPPLSIRILSRDRDVYLDVGGGHRVPKLSERKARSVAELRAAGAGVSRVLLFHDGTSRGSDLYRLVLTMLDPQVTFDLAHASETPVLKHDLERAHQLDRGVEARALEGPVGPTLAGMSRDGAYDLIVIGIPDPAEIGADDMRRQIEMLVREARCPVFVANTPDIPRDASRD